MLFDETVEQLRLLSGDAASPDAESGSSSRSTTSSISAGTRVSEASFSGHDTKAALLEDAARRDVVVGNPCVERPQRIDSQEGVEGAGRDPFAASTLFPGSVPGRARDKLPRPFSADPCTSKPRGFGCTRTWIPNTAATAVIRSGGPCR